MKNILILGGTGNISHHFTNLALKNNLKVTTVTRGIENPLRRITKSDRLTEIHMDIKYEELIINNKVNIEEYDVIIDFICYDKSDALKRIKLLNRNLKHYIYISTTAGYEKNRDLTPYSEDTKFSNLEWDYCKNKREAEIIFQKYYELSNFPITIARLGHTYDTALPIAVGPTDWTVPNMIEEKIGLINFNIYNNRWCLLHANDAAEALYEIAKNQVLKGEIINIVSEIETNWEEICNILVNKINSNCKIIKIPPNFIHSKIPYLGNGILWHKMHDEIYDTTKLKKYIPNWFEKTNLLEGLDKSIRWYKSENNRRVINTKLSNELFNLIKEYEAII